MGIPHRHGEGFMTHNHLYRPDINLGYDERGCTGMTEGMSDDPFDFSRFESGKIDPLVKILCIDWVVWLCGGKHHGLMRAISTWIAFNISMAS